MFSILNEGMGRTLGEEQLKGLCVHDVRLCSRLSYYEAYKTIRAVTGIGEGKGPFIVFHGRRSCCDVLIAQDGFVIHSQWWGFLPGGDRIALDQHPYLAFAGNVISNNDPLSVVALKPCAFFATLNESMANFGLSFAGEFRCVPRGPSRADLLALLSTTAVSTSWHWRVQAHRQIRQRRQRGHAP